MSAAEKKSAKELHDHIEAHDHVAQIHPHDVEALRGEGDHPKPLLLDVREDHEIKEQGYGDNVHNLAYMTKMQHLKKKEDLHEHLHEDFHDGERVVVTMCRTGGRSGKAAEKLKEHGWKNVANMVGGMNEYQKHFPVHTPHGKKEPDSS